jgi:hypothetical protein
LAKHPIVLPQIQTPPFFFFFFFCTALFVFIYLFFQAKRIGTIDFKIIINPAC